MEVEKRIENDSVVLAVKGRLDTTTSPDFETVLAAVYPETKSLVFDFRELEYISSAGLRLVLAAYKNMTAKDGTLVLTGVNAEVMDVLDMTGFTGFLEIH